MSAPRASLPCPVTAQMPLGAGYFETEIDAPAIARSVAPGQFVMVRIPGVGDPLLGRPFSVFSVRDAAGTRISLVYNIVGKATALMAARRPGEELLLFGPLGHPFALDRQAPAQALLVAGGVGIAGLKLLNDTLRRSGVPTTLLYGARGAAELVARAQFEALGTEVALATDDGSLGHKGFVTTLLEERLATAGGARPTLYSCGPSIMMRRVKELALQHGLRCELSLEARMACGFGVCLGCVVPSATTPGSFRLVCKDGPCLEAREIVP